MVLLPPAEYDLARPVLNALDHHLAAACVLEGIVPARLYVNHPDHPTTALAVASRRYFLAGNSENEAFNGSLQHLFAETIYPQAQAAGETMFVLYYQPASWTEKLEQILKDKHPVFTQRQYYRFKELKTDWRSLLPEGFTLRQADREILADPQIKNPDFLTEEMCSERESVDDFLQKSFGLCLVHEHEIVGWCLSEYNHADGCEIGIAVSPPYQRRGFATLLASAFIQTAHSQGITHIGWHCYASNLPSVATALKIGFEKAADYPICLGWFNETDALAVQGDVCFDRQQYVESLDWLERAFACGQVQGWAYWVAACSAAMLGDNKKAFKYLGQAVEKDFADSERLQNSPFLVSLHDYPEWQVLFRFYDHPKKSL